ncbi:hypothetical protein J2795_004338 [Chryseobacterium bernardetii]|jgi:hypothetical protein|uniref:Uncharacterized protein n=3 Tax=Chryseobacterium TaxID=59732 RepID=A0A543DVA3_9FLAO|nr:MULTISPECIES: hypothetical protein [Chryseobacterium]MDR6373149.1 hypothetical protein [Chryseobacterium vietnamense]MDR6443587.1 hypothetical protein [Chryseobacterium bernardetii]MDR6461195.1 hypothetical protein [Chryseobacterium vietnamense]TQM13247.1 hypothetical protein FB551_4617 [Chryseobacterium aquifrigidense]
MGTLIKLIFLIFILQIKLVFSQACIIKINEQDSINLEKLQRNEYRLSFFNKKNIEYNKSKGLNYNNFVHGVRFCDVCKEEVAYFLLQPIKKKITRKDSIYSIEKSFEKKCLSKEILFQIDNKFYKHIKTFE